MFHVIIQSIKERTPQMNQIKAVELERKKIANGHVIVTYQAGDFVYYNEYENEQAISEKNSQKIISKSYIQKSQNGGFTHIYVHPQNNTQLLKTLTYDKNNRLTLETHFYANKNKSLVRFYSDGILTHAWNYTENGEIKLGTYYQKNNQNKYEISHISKPIFDNKNELTHLVMMETDATGKPTGKIIERMFYLLNKPSIRVNYIKNPQTNKSDEIIYSHENGKWLRVANKELEKQLKNIFEKLIAFESSKNAIQLTLEKNSNVSFEELYYHDVFLFKQTHSDLQVFIPQSNSSSSEQPPLN